MSGPQGGGEGRGGGAGSIDMSKATKSDADETEAPRGDGQTSSPQEDIRALQRRVAALGPPDPDFDMKRFSDELHEKTDAPTDRASPNVEVKSLTMPKDTDMGSSGLVSTTTTRTRRATSSTWPTWPSATATSSGRTSSPTRRRRRETSMGSRGGSLPPSSAIWSCSICPRPRTRRCACARASSARWGSGLNGSARPPGARGGRRVRTINMATGSELIKVRAYHGRDDDPDEGRSGYSP